MLSQSRHTKIYIGGKFLYCVNKHTQKENEILEEMYLNSYNYLELW
jgi:hypothetical protein